MMPETLYAALTLVLQVLAMLVTPARATCPSGHYVNGIRPSGAFSCLPTPVGDPEYDGTYGKPDRSVQPPGELESRIYCTGGTHPVVRDHRTVGCQR